MVKLSIWSRQQERLSKQIVRAWRHSQEPVCLENDIVLRRSLIRNWNRSYLFRMCSMLSHFLEKVTRNISNVYNKFSGGIDQTVKRLIFPVHCLHRTLPRMATFLSILRLNRLYQNFVWRAWACNESSAHLLLTSPLRYSPSQIRTSISMVTQNVHCHPMYLPRGQYRHHPN